MAKRLVLGSGSPRRRELMARAGFEFEVVTSDAEESYEEGLAPVEVAPALAAIKARAVWECLADDKAVVVGADTIVALGDEIFGKPHDETDACRMLAELSGKTHQVITGVCVVSADGEKCFAEVTDVVFKKLAEDEIAEYVAGGEPMDKAGAYGIQGAGGKLVDHIAGDFDNVVGLPIGRLEPMLRETIEVRQKV